MHLRSEWEHPAYRVADHTNAGPVRWGEVRNVVIHYTAADFTPATGVGPYIAAIQRDYVNTRGYSIGYNYAVDRTGETWELRGDDFECAANGSQATNRPAVAVLCLVNGADAANTAMTVAVRGVVAMCEQRAGRPLDILGHKDVRATGCPGTGLYTQVKDGTFRPRTIPPPTTEDDDMLVIRIDGFNDQFLCVPIDTPSARRKMDIPDSHPPVVVKADRAQIEAQIPYKLTPRV